MFVKKSSAVQLPKIMQQKIREEIKSKEINHEFFLLVRDQKYEQAYILGMTYLKYFPQNHVIQRFCYFIKHNREELLKMVDEEQNYTDDESEDCDEGDDEEDDQDEEEDKESVISQKSSVNSKKSITSVKNQVNPSKSVKSLKSISSSKSSNSTQSKGKQNNEICKLHKWSHICKNVNCPNKKK